MPPFNPSENGPFSVLEAWRDFGHTYITILEVGVAIQAFADFLLLFKAETSILTNGLHGQKADMISIRI